MNERARQSELLLHSARKRVGAPIREHLDLPVHGRDQRITFFQRRAEYGCEKGKILSDGEVAVKRKPARHVPDSRPNCPEVLDDVELENCCPPAVGNLKCRQDSEQSRFTRAVGTDETKELAVIRLERDCIESDLCPELFGDFTDDNGRLCHVPCFFVASVRSPGIPILRSPWVFGTRTFTA